MLKKLLMLLIIGGLIFLFLFLRDTYNAKVKEEAKYQTLEDYARPH